MSGAVERLLARSAGRLATARPLLPGRFESVGPVADWLPEPAAADEPRRGGGEGHEREAGEPRRRGSRARTAAVPAAVERVEKEVRVVVERPSLETLRPADVEPRRSAPELSLPSRPALETETPAPTAAAPIASRQPPAEPGLPVREAPARSTPATAGGPELAEPATGRGRLRPQLPALAPSRPPSLAATPRSSAPAAPAVPPRSRRAAGAPVEVRIGRVEVRAAAPGGVKAAPPSGDRAPRPARRPAVSLDDYLRRRRRA